MVDDKCGIVEITLDRVYQHNLVPELSRLDCPSSVRMVPILAHLATYYAFRFCERGRSDISCSIEFCSFGLRVYRAFVT